MDHAPTTIDHLVLPVRDLGQARQRYEALGFNVAPDALHPFGTENCCVFLGDGTYLEPLGIADRIIAESEMRAGNPFLRRDLTYRFRVDEEGMSMLAMRTNDAAKDLARYASEGLAFSDLFGFSRKAKQGDEEVQIAVKVAVAADDRAPDAAFFACERTNMDSLWHKDRVTHENGVTGISAVLMCEENPTDFQYILQAATGMRDYVSSSNGLSFHMDGADLFCFTPVALEQLFSLPAGTTQRGLQFEGVVFTCNSVPTLKRSLDEQGIDCFVHLGRLIVPAGPGQGIPFLFEEGN